MTETELAKRLEELRDASENGITVELAFEIADNLPTILSALRALSGSAQAERWSQAAKAEVALGSARNAAIAECVALVERERDRAFEPKDSLSRQEGAFDMADHLVVSLKGLFNGAAPATILTQRAALENIAKSTCCDCCQEAALVAQAALDSRREWRGPPPMTQDREQIAPDLGELIERLKGRVADFYKATRVLDFCEYTRAEAHLDLAIAERLQSLSQALASKDAEIARSHDTLKARAVFIAAQAQALKALRSRLARQGAKP